MDCSAPRGLYFELDVKILAPGSLVCFFIIKVAQNQLKSAYSLVIMSKAFLIPLNHYTMFFSLESFTALPWHHPKL